MASRENSLNTKIESPTNSELSCLNWIDYAYRLMHIKPRTEVDVQLLLTTHYMSDSVYLLTVKQNASRGYLRFCPTLYSALCLASMSHTLTYTHTSHLYRAHITPPTLSHFAWSSTDSNTNTLCFSPPVLSSSALC